MHRQTTVKAGSELAACELAGEIVILDLKSGTYYGLDRIGAQVWHLIQEPRRVEEVCSVLIGEYDVEPERCEREVLELLGQLRAERLIDVMGSGDG